MTKKFYGEGEILTIAGVTRSVSSGGGYLHGARFGVVLADVASNGTAALLTEGLVAVDKATGVAFTAGQRVFWDNTNFNVNGTTTGQYNVGIALAAASSAQTSVQIMLGPVTPSGT